MQMMTMTQDTSKKKKENLLALYFVVLILMALSHILRAVSTSAAAVALYLKPPKTTISSPLFTFTRSLSLSQSTTISKLAQRRHTPKHIKKVPQKVYMTF